MGCSASKEAVATSSPPAPKPKTTTKAPSTESLGSSNAHISPKKKQPPEANTPATEESAPPLFNTNTPTPGQNFIHLNDVVPGSNVSPGGGHGGRGRFLSYASGASTPNTSSGNLSWDGEGSGDSKNSDKPSRVLHDFKNPKSLKHSNSAIGLDDLHADSNAGLTSKVVHIEVPFGKPIEEVYDGVHNGPVLGSGVSGLVRLVKHKATGLDYAVKCLDLGLVGTKEGLAQLREEIFIMCQLDHPNIVRLEEVYESHSEIYLVQELCVGGELFDRLDEQPDYHYTEAECARLVKQMLSAIRYLHSKGVIHRDLKLENFLFSSKAQDSELKMIDFGLSKHFRFGEVHHEAVGTPYTVAPEVIHGSYDERCDIWAIGVIAFLLLSGDPPFGGCGGPEPLLRVRANILAGKFVFEPEDIWSLVSTKAKEFVSALLVIDPKSRPTAREAQKHPWLREWASRQSKMDDNLLNPNVVRALVNFKEYSDMRKLLSEVLSFTLLPEQIKDLRKEFEKMDTDGSGEISLAALKQVLMTNAGAGSLGALTEEEVEDIFDAMRVNKSETRIHWHEFIAAGLSQCQVDDRNLRLAFDRLDSDHKGYITLDDITHLVGSDELHSEEQMRCMWRESMKSVNCTQAHITYDNFLLLMKGQTKEPEPLPIPVELLSSSRMSISKMTVVTEGILLDIDDDAEVAVDDEVSKARAASQTSLGSHFKGEETDPSFLDRKSLDEVSLHSLPNIEGTPGMYESSNSGDCAFGSSSPGMDTPPAAGRNLIADIAVDEADIMPVLGGIAKPGVVRRGRSKTLGEEKDADEPEEPQRGQGESSPSFRADTRRAMALPEQDGKMSDELAKRRSALEVNRTLYRAHRQMRLSVMEASRRFEEQQARRARDTLIARKEAEEGLAPVQAGLVMRHGTKVHVTSETIHKYLEEYRAEQQQKVEKANRRGGRGRSSRKKTISDMSAMMNPSMGQEELGDIAILASKTPDTTKNILHASLRDFEIPLMPAIGGSLMGGGSPPSPPRHGHGHGRPPKSVSVVVPTGEAPPIPVVDKDYPRNATVPGEFRKTQDPFGSSGMYGGARMSSVDVNQISTTPHTWTREHTHN